MCAAPTVFSRPVRLHGRAVTRTVAIIADHCLVREGLQALVSRDPWLEVIGLGGSHAEALTLVAACAPDVLLISAEVRGSPVIQLVSALRQRHPGIILIVLTVQPDRIIAYQLRIAGAARYLSKDVSAADLALVLKTATTPPKRANLQPREEFAVVTALTCRELEVLRLVSLAHSNKEIGRLLSLAEATVKRHMSNIFSKLDAKSRLDAVRRATKRGIFAEL